MTPTTFITAAIPGVTDTSQVLWKQLLAAKPTPETLWLFSSRAMGRHQASSGISLGLEGAALKHGGRHRLMATVDELLVPWKMDLVLLQQLRKELEAHVQRVRRCIWRRP